MSGLGAYLPAHLGHAGIMAAAQQAAAQQGHVAKVHWQTAKASFLAARDDFDFESTVERAKELAADGAAWARENPEKAALYGAGAVGLVTVAAPGAVSAPVLALTGFGSGGPISGSLAAGIQSGLGNVIAPSLFSTCQSAAMGGSGLAVVNAAVQAGGAALAAGAGGAAATTGGKKGEEEKGGA